MADHDITLTYAANAGAGAVVADPFSITVSPGQTIAFHLGSGSQLGTIQITFRDRHFFHANNPHFTNDGIFHPVDGVVTVAAKPAGRTTYHCELLDAQGNTIAVSHENGGGEILPSN